VVNGDGSYVNDAGCGNIIDAASPAAQELLLTSLDRLADLGVDGLRFDLAAVLARNPAFIRSIGDWAERRGVRLIAEPWDLTRYLAGRDFPDARWAQWNGKFRDDLRGFLRGEGGLVGKVLQRVQGSPDLFDTPGSSINMLTAHDGFTLRTTYSYCVDARCETPCAC
jgi:glycogen operon protein